MPRYSKLNDNNEKINNIKVTKAESKRLRSNPKSTTTMATKKKHKSSKRSSKTITRRKGTE